MYSIGDTYLRLFVTTGIAAIFCDIPTLHTGNTATFPVLMRMSLAAHMEKLPIHRRTFSTFLSN